jgi:hypothetical protein
MTTKKAYAGIGSRETPEDILLLMRAAARALENAGLMLRSGGANGADTAFEHGVYHWPNKQIFLPWSGFNKRTIRQPGCYVLTGDFIEQAHAIAAEHHPAWNRLARNIQALHARNVAQVLGPELNDPVQFVMCWTPQGKGGGGTGQAIRIAKSYHVPVFDMAAMSTPEIENAIGDILGI